MLTGLSLLCNHLGNAPASFLNHQLPVTLQGAQSTQVFTDAGLYFSLLSFLCVGHDWSMYMTKHAFLFWKSQLILFSPFFGLCTYIFSFCLFIIKLSRVCFIKQQKSNLHTAIHLSFSQNMIYTKLVALEMTQVRYLVMHFL